MRDLEGLVEKNVRDGRHKICHAAAVTRSINPP